MTSVGNETARWTWRDSVWALALAGAAVAIYVQGYQNEFLSWDDEAYIAGNYWVRMGLTWPAVVHAFSSFAVANYHPLTMLSHMADVSLWSSWAGGHALTSMAWHTANGVLLYVALRALSGRRTPSAFVAALFVVHPLHVESVAWIAERKDVLCGFFWILAMWLYAGYARAPSWGRYLGVSAAVALSLLAKPMAVTLPVALFCLDIWPLRRFDPARPLAQWWGVLRPLIAEKLLWFAMAMAIAVLTLLAQEKAMPTGFDAGYRYLAIIVSYGAYLSKTFWPADLQFFYIIERVLSLPMFAFSFVALFGGSWLVWRQRGARPYLLAGWLWFVLTLVPVVGVVKVGTQAFADRYTYLPLIGLFWMLVWWVDEQMWRHVANPQAPLRTIALGLALAGLAGLSVLSWQQAATWRNGGTLYANGLAKDPKNYVALQGLGYWAFLQKRYDEAIDYSRRALEMAQGPAMVRAATIVIADTRYAQGRYDEALSYYRKAIDAEEEMAHGAYLGIGLVMLQKGDLVAAEKALRRAIELQPMFSYAFNNLGVVLYRQGRMAESLAAHLEAARVDPGNVMAYFNAAQRLEARGDLAAAQAQIQALLKLFPQHERGLREAARYAAAAAAAAAR